MWASASPESPGSRPSSRYRGQWCTGNWGAVDEEASETPTLSLVWSVLLIWAVTQTRGSEHGCGESVPCRAPSCGSHDAPRSSRPQRYTASTGGESGYLPSLRTYGDKKTINLYPAVKVKTFSSTGFQPLYCEVMIYLKMQFYITDISEIYSSRLPHKCHQKSSGIAESS